jgi:hypothetical protein
MDRKLWFFDYENEDDDEDEDDSNLFNPAPSISH